MAIRTKYAKTKVYDTPLHADPQSTQEVFPVKSIDDSGIFELNNHNYSKAYVLSDINFAGLTSVDPHGGLSEQERLILNLSGVFNSLNVRFSYSVANEYVNEKDFNNKILYRLRGDKYDPLRQSYNSVIREKLTDAKQGLYQTIYFTLTLRADNLKEAKSSFTSVEASLRSSFVQIGIDGMAGPQLHSLAINERMQLWYNFTHTGIRGNYKFDFENELKAGRDWANVIAPASMCFYNTYFRMNGKFGRVLYISEYPKSLESDILTELSSINCTSYITINNELLDSTGYKQEIQRKSSAVGLQIESEKKRNRDNNDFLSDASNTLLSKKESLDKLLAQLSEGDYHFFNTTILVMILADTAEELETLTGKISSIASVKSFALEVCFDKQREALNSAFPFGAQEFKRVCNLSAPCLAMFMPFKTQELNDEGGLWYGINQISQNAIFGDKKKLKNYNGLILGQSGSGKSVFAKMEIISSYVNYTDDQIIIIDPQSEYGPLTKAVDGSVISFSSSKEIYVNPLDVNFDGVDYVTLTEIIGDKSDFVLTLLACCMKKDLTPEEQFEIDTVVEKVYNENYAMRKRLNGEDTRITEYSVPEYMQTRQSFELPKIDMSPEEQERAYSPTLQDIYQGLLDRDTVVAKKLAAHMQIFVNGSLNLFNHRTNIDLHNRFLVFDISNIKENLRITSMLVMLEIVKNKIRQNASTGRWTHLYIDEFHELLAIDAVASFILKLWKEIRKMHGICTGITQNMVDLLNKSANSQSLEGILSNSEYFALLSQSSLDKKKLIEFLPNISPALFNYVEGAESGCGLLKMGNTTIPFDIRMDKNSLIYSIVNTDGGINAVSV